MQGAIGCAPALVGLDQAQRVIGKISGLINGDPQTVIKVLTRRAAHVDVRGSDLSHAAAAGDDDIILADRIGSFGEEVNLERD